MSTTALPAHPAKHRRFDPGGAVRSLVRGRAEDPPWVRPALFGVLAIAALLFLWDLTRNGYSNEYYAAAARAGSESWKTWFFGALDPGSFITVDKPPLSLWLSGLSARVLGFSSFSILLPQALCSVAAVGVLYATVRRAFGAPAGLLAALALALTPVTVAIARVNNPDALLVLLMVASAYMLQRAVESGRTKHLVWCATFVGLAFMTKLLQGWMVVPALALTYLIAGPPRLLVRIRQLAIAGVTMVAVSAAWPLAVSLWPGAKPYIGGSSDGTIWNLIFGYDGFGRIFGGSGGNGGGMSFGGASGLLRMFNEQVGGQVAWLIPLAAVGLVAGLWLTRRTPRTDLRRAGLVLFGTWALVHVAIFSSQQGIFHPYYVSALAPALAALAAIGIVMLAGRARRSWAALVTLDAAIAATAWLAVVLLGRTADFAPALRVVIPIAAAVAIAGSLWLRIPRGRTRLALAVAGVAAAIAVLAGPAAYSIATVGRDLSGNNVLAGPASVGSGLGGGGGGFGSGSGGSAPRSASGFPGSSSRAGAPPSSGSGTRPSLPSTRSGSAPSGTGGGMAGGGQLSSTAIAYLEAHQGSAKYLLAASGSQTTAPIIISTGKAVVTIGGFNGGDPAPTVSQLAKLVSSGQLKYVLLSSSGGAGGGGSSNAQAIATWVKAHGTKVTAVSVSGGTLYKVG